MSLETIKLQQEANDLQGQMLHCAEVAKTEDHDELLAEFYTRVAQETGKIAEDLQKPA